MAAELCVALDGGDRRWIVDTARLLAVEVGWLKIGLEAFTALGPGLVEEVGACGPRVFLDLKLHDIPNTVARSAAHCVRAGAAMINVHAAGGRAMLRAAVEAVRQTDGGDRTRVIAVTLLTSLGRRDLRDLGVDGDPHELVVRWAELACAAGLDGVVASAGEAPDIRRSCGEGFVIVTPGIRPAGAAQDDQCRVATPAAAVAAGADILVVGRPVTSADDPAAAARRIVCEMRPGSV